MDDITKYKLATYDDLLADCVVLLDALRKVEDLTMERIKHEHRKQSSSKTLRIIRKALRQIHDGDYNA